MIQSRPGMKFEFKIPDGWAIALGPDGEMFLAHPDHPPAIMRRAAYGEGWVHEELEFTSETHAARARPIAANRAKYLFARPDKYRKKISDEDFGFDGAKVHGEE